MIHKLGFCWCGTAHATLADIDDSPAAAQLRAELIQFAKHVLAHRDGQGHEEQIVDTYLSKQRTSADDLRRGYRECIELLENWGQLALSSDYAGPQDGTRLAKDIARHKDIWLGRDRSALEKPPP